MKVYRVENALGEGPFQSTHNHEDMGGTWWMQWRWNYIGDRHPSPWYDDLEDYLHKGYVFACPNLDMLCHWFAPIMDILEDMGFKVVEVDARDVKWGKSNTQVMFHAATILTKRVMDKQEYLEAREYYGES